MANVKEENMRISILVICYISQLISADFNGATYYLECPEKILLQFSNDGSVVCYSRNVAKNLSTNFNVTVEKKINYCGPDFSQFEVEAPSLGNTSIKIQFYNVSWQAAGVYELKLAYRNITKVQNFSIEVSDIPVLPKTIKFTAEYYENSYVFAFYGAYVNRSRCDKAHTTYISNYRTKGCPVDRTGNFSCTVVNDSNRKQKDILCNADSLLICDDKKIKSCQLDITLMGLNELGHTVVSNYSSPDLKFTDIAFKPYLMEVKARESSKLTLSWMSPCKTFPYRYNISYWSSKDSRKLLRSFEDNSNTVSYQLTKLKPYTRYRICIKAINKENNQKSGKCMTADTEEGIPSKSPFDVVVKDFPGREEDIRRSIGISWVTPAHQYWNGKAFVTIECKEKKSDRAMPERNVSVNTFNYTIVNVYKDRGYYIRVNLCTSKGCNHSQWETLKALNSPVVKDDKTVIIIVLVAISVVLGFIVFIWCCIKVRSSKKYGHLKEEQGPVKRGDGTPTVGPRLKHEYEYPVTPTALNEQFDAFPTNNTEINRSVEDFENDSDTVINVGRLQLNMDIAGAGSHESIELPRV